MLPRFHVHPCRCTHAQSLGGLWQRLQCALPSKQIGDAQAQICILQGLIILKPASAQPLMLASSQLCAGDKVADISFALGGAMLKESCQCVGSLLQQLHTYPSWGQHVDVVFTGIETENRTLLVGDAFTGNSEPCFFWFCAIVLCFVYVPCENTLQWYVLSA